MRIITVLIAVLLASGAARAQDFDPFQAVRDGLSINAAIPIITNNVGPVLGIKTAGVNLLGTDEGDEPLMMVTADYGGSVPAMFIFCRGALIGFDSPISKALADSLTEEIGVDPESEELVVDGNVRVRLADGKTQIAYFNPPDAEPWVDLLHPYLSFQRADFSEMCPEN
jgi:hypothetical protein